MVNFCAVFRCSNGSNRNNEKSFYRLPGVKGNVKAEPKNLLKERRSVWLQRLRRADITPDKYKNIRIYSDHFSSGKPASLLDKENVDWAPNKNLGYNSSGARMNVERSRRLSQLNEKRDRNECAAALVKLSGTVLREVSNSEQHCIVADAESQTDISMDFLHNHESEIQRLQQENAELKKQLHEKCFNESTFEGNDEKVLFYTGLPKWSTLFAVFGLDGLDM